ncbi:gelsolin-like protein 2 [Sycon ciliatum]|uniref:gelsolin-like protein 2 n=1 Tax=Sycon ciliatum TaxID=27933 RepID=UPI0031F6C923
MLKGKDYTWQQSNLSIVGTDLERNVKKASAETEQAWQGAGKDVGQQIWRIEKFKVVPWNQDNYGSFYSGDSYIILNTYREGEELKHNLHFWIGRHSTSDEYATAAYKAVELDTFLNDKPIQYREVHGNESELFKGYFREMQIWSGGIDSGFRHVEPKTYQTRLMHFEGTRKNIVVKEIDLLKSNVSTNDVYILDQGLTIYLWSGSNSNKDKRLKASQFVTQLKTQRGKAQSEFLDEAHTPQTHPFWQALPEGEPKQVFESDSKTFVPVLLRLSDASGGLEMTKIAEGQRFERSRLDSNDVFILDDGTQIFVWIGREASSGESSKAIEYGHNYAKETKHPFVPILRIVEGQHVGSFESRFS